MKDNYDGYPEPNRERFLTDQWYDYEEYLKRFYNDQEFHVERIARGQEIKEEAIKEAIVDGVQSGIYFVLIASVFAQFLYAAGNIFSDVNATIVTNILQTLSTLSVGTIEGISLIAIMNMLSEPIKEDLKKISHINKDIKVSEEMIERIEDSEENSHGL